MEKIELRSIKLDTFGTSSDLTVTGLVNRTGTWSRVMGKRNKFREMVLPGVFTRAIKSANQIDFLGEHDRKLLLSSTQNDALELYEDSEGLKMKANIAPTSYGKDIYELIKSGLCPHMSFGMKVLEDSWARGVDGIMERTIKEIAISEISAVRNPAYIQSAIEARGIEVVEDINIPEIKENKKTTFKDELEAMAAELKAELIAELIIEDTKNEVKKEENIIMENNTTQTENRTMSELPGLEPRPVERPIIKKLIDNRLFKGIDIRHCTESGKTIFPSIEIAIEKTEEVNGTTIITTTKDKIKPIELQTSPLQASIEISQELLNEMNPDMRDFYMEKKQYDLIELESYNRLSRELNKVAPIDTGDITGEPVIVNPKRVELLFAEYDNSYLGNNFIVCNKVDYKKMARYLDTTGKKLLVDYDIDPESKIRAYINGAEIIVNDKVDKVILYNPSCIAMAIGKLYENFEIKDSALRRAGIIGKGLLVANGFAVIDEAGIKSVSLV